MHPHRFDSSADDLSRLEDTAARVAVIGAQRRARWAVVLGLTPRRSREDGMWEVAFGDDPGRLPILGRGWNPEEAIVAFDAAMTHSCGAIAHPRPPGSDNQAGPAAGKG